MSETRSLTILAFDFGLARTGVAIGNTVTGGGRPLETIETERNDARFGRIGELVDEWHPDILVVGLPVDADGADTGLTRRVRRFGNQLGGRFGLPVEFVDERHTSAIAEGALKAGREGKARVDAAAAAVFLQAWLDQRS